MDMDEVSINTIGETSSYPSLDCHAVDSDELSIGTTTSETHFKTLDEAVDSLLLANTSVAKRTPTSINGLTMYVLT